MQILLVIYYYLQEILNRHAMTLAQLDPDANLGKNEQVDHVEQLGNVGEVFPSYTKTWASYHPNLVLSNSYFKCSDVDI